jgi:RimJ/RimL family protein N-acetyltransferase
VAGSLLEARNQGVRRAILFTDRDNEPARRAYEALGFTVVGNYSIVLFDTPQVPLTTAPTRALVAPSDRDCQLITDRLFLTPITIGDAESLFMLLQEPSLYVFTKGSPPADIAELSGRIESWQSRKSPAADEIWLNWTVRLHSTSLVIGHLQASITEEHADLAWVVGRPFQGQGYATEAASAVARWIQATFPDRELRANIHSEHIASQRVARKIGLEPTADTTSEGEIVWKTGTSSSAI